MGEAMDYQTPMGLTHVSYWSAQPWSEALWSKNIGEVACEDKDPGQTRVRNRSQQAKAESDPVAFLDLK